MPRRPRLCMAGEVYHVTVRGNNRQAIFEGDLDRREYLQVLLEATQQLEVTVHAFVLMSNHVHLLLQPLRDKALSQALQLSNATYAKYINHRYGRTGHLFQGRFHSSHVSRDAHLLVVSRYIHNNPVRAGIVKDAVDYPWSSIKVFVGGLSSRSSLDRRIKRLVDPTLTLSLLTSETSRQHALYRALLNSVSDTEMASLQGTQMGV